MFYGVEYRNPLAAQKQFVDTELLSNFLKK